MDCISESWLQVISLFLANAALIIWFRAESRSDWRHLDAKVDANQKETNQILKAIQDEMKDFHVKLALQDQEFKMRLCAIEERNRNAK